MIYLNQIFTEQSTISWRLKQEVILNSRSIFFVIWRSFCSAMYFDKGAGTRTDGQTTQDDLVIARVYYVMSVTISAQKWCSVCLYLKLSVGTRTSYLRYLCLFVHSGVQHILYCVFALFFFVLCAIWCQFLLIVHLSKFTSKLSIDKYFYCQNWKG
jgi:hypothetical protein